MSAFLGPIHHWLYNKILIEERLVQDILQLNQEKGYVTDLAEEADKECGIIEGGPLEEMITTDNIHGWLQARVSIVELRLAYVVTAIVKDEPFRMEEILEASYQEGRRVAKESDMAAVATAEEAFEKINNIVLDGMPCDRINELLQATEEEVVFRHTRCIHEHYWIEVGGLVMYYYDIRRKLLEGALLDTPFELTVNEAGESVIRRK